MFKNMFTLTCILTLTSSNVVAGNNNDWRKTGSDVEKLNNIIKVIPSTSDLMFQMGERYRNLYWAGKQKKWAFAEYQVEEMEGLMKKLKITRPQRATSIEKYFSTAFKPIEAAIQSKNWQQFSLGFESMRKQCMACHKANDHAFIILKPVPRKGNSPVID